MARVLLDTTVLIDVLRGRTAGGRLMALRDTGDSPYTSALNVEEIFRGVLPGEAEAAELLIDGLRVVPIGKAEGRRAGEWRRDHATRGITLSQADCLIAAAAVSIGGVLCTGNPKDFPMAEVHVEHWPVGE